MCIIDWSSDVCSSDLVPIAPHPLSAAADGSGLVMEGWPAVIAAVAIVVMIVGIAPVVTVARLAVDDVDSAARIVPSVRPISVSVVPVLQVPERSEEHTSELQSLMLISYAVFCLKKKKNKHN